MESMLVIAFVLSGGGSRGAMEAGGIKALLEAGIHPNMVVGSSVGALNAVHLAADPTPAGAAQLCDLWCSLRTHDLLPGGRLARAWRLLTGQLGIFAQEPLRAFLRSHLPPGVETFGDLPSAVALYVTVTSLQTSSLYLYGEDRSASLLDALLATAAFPGCFPPCSVAAGSMATAGYWRTSRSA